MAQGQKKAVDEGRTLVWIDESGFALSPALVRTYAPRGRTPILRADLGRVVLDQPVDVTVDSFPGRTFRGAVRRVATEAEYTPRNISTRDQRENLVFAVEVWLPNPDGALKPGMPADAVFGPPRPALMLRTRPADILRELATPTPTPTETPPATATPTQTPLPSLTPTPAEPCRASITANLNVRSGPGTAYRILGTLKWPYTVEVSGRLEDNSWWRIEYHGERGWISARYTETDGSCTWLPVETP